MIDSPPCLSLVTVNILQAVTDVLVPIDSGIYSVAGLGRLNDTIEMLKKNLDHDPLHIIGLVLTKAMKNAATTSLERQLRETFGKLVYQTVIPFDAKVEEAAACHRTVLEFAPGSQGGRRIQRPDSGDEEHGQKQSAPPDDLMRRHPEPGGRPKETASWVTTRPLARAGGAPRATRLGRRKNDSAGQGWPRTQADDL